MSLTKQTVIDQITVQENGIVLYREATRIMEDGVQLSQTYHRSSLTPAQDLTGLFYCHTLCHTLEDDLLSLVCLFGLIRCDCH